MRTCSVAAVRLGSALARLLMAVPFGVSRVESSRAEPPEPLEADPQRQQRQFISLRWVSAVESAENVSSGTLRFYSPDFMQSILAVAVAHARGVWTTSRLARLPVY